MIARGFLFQGIVVPCLSHTDGDVDVFIEALAGALPIYARVVAVGDQAHLVDEPAKPVFRKLL